jgi:hypothetical protein
MCPPNLAVSPDHIKIEISSRYSPLAGSTIEASRPFGFLIKRNPLLKQFPYRIISSYRTVPWKPNQTHAICTSPS